MSMSFTNKNLVIFALLSSFLSSEIYDFKEINLSDEKMNLSKEIFRKLERNHFLKNKYLVDFNQNYIESLIDKLDENKMYFTEDEVFNFINLSNSEIKVNYDLELAYKIINLYFSRIVEYSNYQINLINQIEFDFEKKDFMDIYYEDNLWPIDKKSLKEIWKLSTKNDLLVLKLTEEASLDPKKDLVKRYNNRIKRISQQKEEDIFSLAINILTNQFDPHSSYLSPRSAEDFDMDMSLSLEGIGALLGTDDDYTRIVSLVPGGPAEKSGKISPDDKITRIRQTDSENFVDVVGWRIDEVVRLIRGDSGTKVEIELISSETGNGADRKKVILQREEIKLEDRAAKSKIYESDDGYKIGIVDLPSFYIDFNSYQDRDLNYRSSSKDVKKILEQFNENNVDAVVLDLRNNGGGALMEANRIIGLFVSSGPTVQIKYSAGYIQPWGSSRAVQIWKKPVIVLVNRYSASASEIVAAAIQDYNRGIVVGHRTFGKGTVQSLENLSSGQIKVTESKYYRIDGTSTQNKGVLPDIILPSTWDTESVGESSYSTSLSWDTIRPYKHKKFYLPDEFINVIKLEHSKRLENEPNLKYISQLKERYDLNKNKKVLSLNLDERNIQKSLRRSWLLQIENERRINLGYEPFKSYEDYDNTNNDPSILENEIDLKKDFLLIESTNIAIDFLNLSKSFMVSMNN